LNARPVPASVPSTNTAHRENHASTADATDFFNSLLEPLPATVPDGKGGKKLVDSDLCVSPGKLASNVYTHCEYVRDERSGEITSVKTAGFASTSSEGGALASTVIGTAEAAGSLMYGVGAIKQAFSPTKVPQDQTGASTTFSFSQAASGAVALQSTVVPSRGGGGIQTKKPT
jgi:hypothetical protein